RPEPHPEPISTVPFPRDPEFVNRDALLDQIHQKATIAGSRIVLVGLGGVGSGKTQLAAEYYHRVFWIHTSNAARYEKSLGDLADRVKIPGRKDRNANIFQLILVLDNVDDNELLRKSIMINRESQAKGLSSASTQPPLRYLLESSYSTILVTSRNAAVALDIADCKNHVKVQPIDKAEALELLQKKLNMRTECENMMQLVEALEFMPLAIVQAAAYITHRSPRFSVSQYLEKVRKSDQEAVRLLDYEAGLLYRDWEAKNSILLAWQISFDYIQCVRPSATGLLSLMSFFDRQGIPESILRLWRGQENNSNIYPERTQDSSYEEEGDCTSDSDSDQHFEDNITTLCNFSLISIGEHNTGRWEEAEQLFMQVMDTRKMKFGEDHAETLVSMANLAAIYRNQGRWEEAEKLGWQVMETRGTKLGDDHPDTLVSMNNLAVIYKDQRRWEEAEQLFVQVMKIRKTKLGDDHPDTLVSMNNLAVTYKDRHRWEEAEQLFVQVMNAFMTKLGKDHPFTLTSMANLASTYRNQGRWEEAEKLEVQVMETRKTKLGKDHPDTLTSMANLAFTWKSSGKTSDAINVLRDCLAKQKHTIGPNHPYTMSNAETLLR
ncbi:uncharacterized protein N7458_006577, partial [Penicillium daleae]